MLTTKNRVARGRAALLTLCAAVWFSGCTPAGPRALLDGERLLEEGRTDRAIQRLERAQRLLPQDPRAWSFLGLAYHKAGRPEDAAHAYQQAIVLNPEFATARFNLGCLALEQGDFPTAIEELSTALVALPDFETAWVTLGNAQLRDGQIEAADHSFRQALQLDGRLPEAWKGLGLVQHQRRRYPEAYRSFQTALDWKPDDEIALLNAAVVAHQHLNNPKLALEKYQAALNLTPPPRQTAVIQGIVRRLEEELRPAPPTEPAPAIVASVRPEATAPDRGTVARQPPATRTPAPATRPVPAPTPKPAPSAATTTERPGTGPTPRVQPPDSTPSTVPPASTAVSTPASVPPVKDLARVTPSPREEPGVATVQPAAPAATAPAGWESTGSLGSTVARGPEAAGQAPRLSRSTRYPYRSIGVLTPGDRAAAERLVADGVRLHDRNRLAHAMELYQQAARTDATYFDAYYNLGVAAYEDGDLTVALSAYETALALEPNSLKAAFNFAVTLELAGYARDAANELEKLLARHPAEARIHLRLGNLYAGPLRDPGRTRQHFRRVLELDPRHPQASAIRFWLEAN
jgi:tetratricopeptide (TPR) repeat protein